MAGCPQVGLALALLVDLALAPPRYREAGNDGWCVGQYDQIWHCPRLLAVNNPDGPANVFGRHGRALPSAVYERLNNPTSTGTKAEIPSSSRRYSADLSTRIIRRPLNVVHGRAPR